MICKNNVIFINKENRFNYKKFFLVLILDDNENDKGEAKVSCSFGDDAKCEEHKKFMPALRTSRCQNRRVVKKKVEKSEWDDISEMVSNADLIATNLSKSLSSFVINVPNFQERVMEHIKKLVESIECTEEHKKIIFSKSEAILNEHISKAGNNEFTIPKSANLEAFAGNN